MTNHKNDERTVRCPIEGCDSTPLARGINLHIRRSSGGGHGPQGEIPDGVSTDNLETVGAREVEMDYPAERDNDKHARLCPYCNQTFAGVEGMMIHLGQTAGRKNHPANPKDRHEPGDFPRVEVDAEGNVQKVVESPPTGPASDPIPALIAELLAERRTHTAQRLREELLDNESENPQLSENDSHSALFLALVVQSQTSQTDNRVSAVIESEGIMVACRGESAFYTPSEARDVASGLERATRDENPDEEIADLVAFLRHGAEVLGRGEPSRSLHVEFEEWR